MPVSAQISMTGRVAHSSSDTTLLSTASTGPQISYSSNLSTDDVTVEYNRTDTISGITVFDLTSIDSDPFGNIITFTNLKYLQIVNDSDTETLTIGGGSSPWCGDTYTLSAGKGVAIDAVKAISAGAKLIKLVPSGSLIYRMLLVGN